jgi:hypothetical protein
MLSISALMASQRVASYCVSLNYLVTAAYLSTPHSLKFARLVSDDFYLALFNSDFLRIRQHSLVEEFSDGNTAKKYFINDVLSTYAIEAVSFGHCLFCEAGEGAALSMHTIQRIRRKRAGYDSVS